MNDVVKKVAGKVEEDQAQTIAALKVPNKGTRPPLFYGAVKIHKPGYPLRPIVSATCSATFKVSKYVSKILTAYATQLPSFVRKTARFIENIKEIQVEDDEVMISFDVKSLFTSVPRDEAVSAVEEMLVADQSFTSKTGQTISSMLD